MKELIIKVDDPGERVWDGSPKTFEVQELVRCKDCKHRGDRDKCIVAFVAEKQEMPYFFYDNRGEWFCADGKIGEQNEKEN